MSQTLHKGYSILANFDEHSRKENCFFKSDTDVGERIHDLLRDQYRRRKPYKYLIMTFYQQQSYVYIDNPRGSETSALSKTSVEAISAGHLAILMIRRLITIRMPSYFVIRTVAYIYPLSQNLLIPTTYILLPTQGFLSSCWCLSIQCQVACCIYSTINSLKIKKMLLVSYLQKLDRSGVSLSCNVSLDKCFNL